jgi:hypothetical protein
MGGEKTFCPTQKHLNPTPLFAAPISRAAGAEVSGRCLLVLLCLRIHRQKKEGGGSGPLSSLKNEIDLSRHAGT